ncbi:hypothetical protein [Komagataeibacter rhaeticus]|uniref:hypothetical protein n=1 Tax=Komagataeibacter rhaeticus TaxID=215221 RepID=UPI0007DF64C4|nr:hypothetical protein [Komagataeibacter rhaeticus]SAY46929.1 hypothetical protein KRIGEM_03494 [Komagataeibacter rhaeticus]
MLKINSFYLSHFSIFFILFFPFASYANPKEINNYYVTSLFNADQTDRKDPANINWKVLSPRDQERRKNLQKIMNDGGLRTATDYYHAAYIFQHGDNTNDFLLAHCLAVTSLTKGSKNPDAAWIAAATLDRFLQRSGKPQIYGTQTTIINGGPPTLEPYDKTLLSDSLRKAAQVPSLKQQAADLKETAAVFSKTSH